MKEQLVKRLLLSSRKERIDLDHKIISGGLGNNQILGETYTAS